jgi:hypothetical protein
MKITIEMPQVSACEVTECAYNVERGCHARAITIGDDVHPGCDTFFTSTKHASHYKKTAGVGACKVSGCTFNEEFECMADAIEVGFQGGDINCLTYTPR